MPDTFDPEYPSLMLLMARTWADERDEARRRFFQGTKATVYLSTKHNGIGYARIEGIEPTRPLEKLAGQGGKCRLCCYNYSRRCYDKPFCQPCDRDDKRNLVFRVVPNPF